MLARKIDSYIRDYYENSRNALLITGARQTGKTYSIRKFGETFENFIEINFIENSEARQAFKNARTTSDILLRLSALVTRPLMKDKTLIFFDEVQACPEVVSAIKFLVDEGSYRYILSGSLLGVELKDIKSEPVGYMGIKEMYPLDFEEFIRAVGVSEDIIGRLKDCWEKRLAVDDFVHGKMIELFRLYLIVGGMPAAVDKYLETNNLQIVTTVQHDILQLYRRDIAKYDPEEKLHITEIFDLIPSELNSKNKRFILKRLNEHAKFRRYENDFLWLKNAGVAIPVYNVEEPRLPLQLAQTRNLFKLFQNDVGLLACQYTDNIQLRILNGDKSINHGSVFENAVAQEITAHGFSPNFYNSKKRGEVDFVVEFQGNVLPIEVKSGKDYEMHRALSNLLACPEYDIPQALVLSLDNLRVEGRIVYAPIYMLMFVQHRSEGLSYYKIDLTGLQ